MPDKPLILIVDDDPINLSIMEEILGEKYRLVQAADGAEAIRAAADHSPALVLLDIMMPQLNGYQACEQIKALPHGPTTHVILVSAKASTAERVQGYNAGADDYLAKPFDEEELLAKVRIQVRLRTALFELSKARAVIAADNRKLEGEVKKQTQALTDTRDLVVFSLAKLADSRDPETGEHLERIRAYCRILAEDLSRNGPYTHLIDAAFVDGIHQASPLHDIGKVGIPDVILLKPGQLTNAEFEQMKQHTVIGADALKEVARHGNNGGFLDMAIDIARSHHEWFNGRGYPDRLVGHEIPLAARICAVADVFDALTSVRVYKAAFTPDTALSMIEEERGTHFDPAVVDALERCFTAMLEVRQQWSPDAAHPAHSAKPGDKPVPRAA